MWTALVSIALGVSALAGAAAAARRWGKGGRRVWRRFVGFLEDWNGEEERPGRERIKGFPERMSDQETTTTALSHFVRGDIAGRLQLLQHSVDESRDQGVDNAAAISRLEQRITDHRRRNEEQITLLQRAVDDLRTRQPQPDPYPPEEKR